MERGLTSERIATSLPSLRLAAILLLAVTESQAASVRDLDIAATLARTRAAYHECAESETQGITVSALSYFDFDGDGSEEAIFVGASCLAGTGGPDVHGVFRLSGTDRLVELEIPESIPPLPLAGNRNFLLYEQEGFLVREYYDSSDREKPLTEYFRWRNGRFWLERVLKSPVFEAGFDCRKARSDAEMTICGHEDLAWADRELGERYKLKLLALSGNRRSAFAAQQKQWLQKRNSDCTYKWIRECLSDLYRSRLKELDTPVSR